MIEAGFAPARPDIRWTRWMVAGGLALLIGIGMWIADGGLAHALVSGQPFAAAIRRGVLIVAVPSRPAPVLYIGKVDRSVRVPDPFLAALAADLAQHVGLPVKLLALSDPAEAQAMVHSGAADAAFVGAPSKPDRAPGLVATDYTAGRGAALVLRHGTLANWHDLSGRSVCAPGGNPFAAQTAREYGAVLHAFDRPLDALLAFQAGECDALVDDEFVIDALLKQADWSYYRKLAGTVEPAPAFIDTRADDAASALYISDTTRRWRHSQWLSDARHDRAIALAFDMFNAENDLYCH